MVDEFVEQLPIFDREPPKPTKGKNIRALEHSRYQRDEILRHFRGVIPESIMAARRLEKTESDPLAWGSYTKSGALQPGDEGFTLFGISGRGGERGALSIFPQNIGRVLLLLYTDEGDCVLDPFAGHNSRMELCVKERRHYIGYDVCREFMDFNYNRAESLSKSYPETQITLHLADSRYMEHTSDCSADFTITSPPYWDREFYGPEVEQIGFARSYSEFLSNLELCMKQNYRCLKPGAFCIWFVNDFRRKGKFYMFHIDTFNLLQSVGFESWDILIADLGQSFRKVFITQLVRDRQLAKRHEYGLIMRKP